jgi:hypothetical protein
VALRIDLLNTASARDVDRFLEFPFLLYQACPQWVPPLIDDVRLH